MSPAENHPAADRDEILSALFAQLVIQQTNMAMMLLGKIANPHTGETMRDPEAASFFIDQLDMLEAKTRGNLNHEEAALLKQSLMSLRMAFVETMNSPEPKAPVAEKSAAPPAPETPAPATPSDPDDASSGKRFSKKY